MNSGVQNKQLRAKPFFGKFCFFADAAMGRERVEIDRSHLDGDWGAEFDGPDLASHQQVGSKGGRPVLTDSSTKPRRDQR